MGQKLANSTFTVTQILDGDSVQGSLMSSRSLVQMWNTDSAKPVPDWTVAANQPTVYPNAYLASEGGSSPKSVINAKWYYNGVLITWNAGANPTSSNFNGMFKKNESFPTGVAGVTTEAITIVRNMASAGNTDNDVIRLSCDVESGGQVLPFSSEIPVKIATIDGSGYYGLIYSVDDDGANAGEETKNFDGDTDSIKMSATLYNANGDAVTTGVTYEWHKNDGAAVVSSDRDYVIGKDDVDSKAIFRCDFIYGGETVASCHEEIIDQTDPYMIATTWTVGPAIRRGQTAEGKLSVVKMAGGGAAPGTWNFTASFTGATGEAATGTGFSVGRKTGTANHQADIEVTYAALDANGGQIQGWAKAEVA